MIPDCQRRLQQAHAELTALLVRYAVWYMYNCGIGNDESPTGLTNCSPDQLKQKGMGHWDLVSYPDYFLPQKKCSLGMRPAKQLYNTS